MRLVRVERKWRVDVNNIFQSFLKTLKCDQSESGQVKMLVLKKNQMLTLILFILTESK